MVILRLVTPRWGVAGTPKAGSDGLIDAVTSLFVIGKPDAPS